MITHVTPLADWVIILPVVLGLMGGALLLMLRRRINLQSWVAGAILVAILACDFVLFERVLLDGPMSMTMGNWLPPFGISFTADVMGAGFAHGRRLHHPGGLAVSPHRCAGVERARRALSADAAAARRRERRRS